MSDILEFIYNEIPGSKGRIDDKLSISANEIGTMIARYCESQKSAIPIVTQWVAVEDSLPDTPWTTVNVLLKNGVVSSMIYSDVGEPWRWYNSSSRAQFPSETNPVVKWAKLPEPPCG